MKSPHYSLLVTGGVSKGTVFPIPEGMAKLGRSNQCDFEIPDPMLSRNHCCFEVRDGRLRVFDLASANQTLVNGEPIDEKVLQAGDVISVGDTELKVIGGDGPEPADAAVPSMPPEARTPTGPVIDLGFGKEEGGSSVGTSAKRPFLRPFLWGLGALLILLLGVLLISDVGKHRPRPADSVQPLIEDKTLLLEYESVEADASSIFRYEMKLASDGTLSVKIDDVGPPEKKADGQTVSGDRHVRKEKKLDPGMLADLIREIETSGFFTLEPSYTGFAAKPNEHEERTLTIAIGKKVHVCHVVNRTDPEEFKALREKLETFSKNELGIWAIQFSTDKLTDLAKDALGVAQKKYAERDVRYGNLFEALHAYQEAIFYLDTVNPKPGFYNDILKGFDAASAELETRYQAQRFRANRAINLSDWETARSELKILCEMIPDRADKRNREASQKLIDVEARLKKRT